jgi:hypothetical protein
MGEWELHLFVVVVDWGVNDDEEDTTIGVKRESAVGSTRVLLGSIRRQAHDDDNLAADDIGVGLCFFIGYTPLRVLGNENDFLFLFYFILYVMHWAFRS